MDRRAFVGGSLTLLAAPLAAEAQPGKVWWIGVLTADRPGAVEALLDGLRERNYVEGRNLVVERRRFTQRDELPTLAAELVRLNLDLVVVGHGQAALVMKATTTTLPIVMAASNDAVAQGIVLSLARPGGNVTGLTNMAPDLVAKRPEILKETAPQASRIAVLGCQTSAGRGSSPEWSAVESASQKRGFHLVPVLIRRSDELPKAFEAALRQKIEAVLVLECAFYPRPELVTAVLNKSRLPAMYPTTRWAQGGGLLCYGPNLIEQYRRASVYVDKILKGAKPADLPVEQPTKFELVINLKTARALGLTIPPSVLARADEVIE